MKNIIGQAFVVMVILSLTACEDSLTKTPETNLSPETFFSNEEELELWTNRFYNLLPDPDDMVKTYADDYVGSSLSSVAKGTRSASTESWTTSTWSYLRWINLLFDYDENCNDEDARLKHEGVAYFFRGLFYYEKVRRYGDIPYYDYVIADTDYASLYKARDSRGYVMYKVMCDLDKAAELLPEEWDSEAVYHVSKYAALALKSRAALFEGTFRRYHEIGDETVDGITISDEWFLEQAAEAAEEIISSGKYSLYTSSPNNVGAYRDFFVLEESPENEVILGILFNTELRVRHSIQFALLGNAMISVTRRFANHYLMADGSRIQDQEGYDTMTYPEMFNNRDPRMGQTLLAPGYVQIGAEDETIETLESDLSGLRIIKFISDDSYNTSTTSVTHWPAYRYPEVLLNYAEAKAELGTLTQEDVDNSINVIRARVSMPGMTLADVNTSPDELLSEYYPNVNSGSMKGAILEIRRERTVELVAEGFRQWDMLRWKEGKFLTPAAYQYKGFEGIYFPGLGEYDMNGDGKNDILLYSGTKPSTTLVAHSIDSSLTLSDTDSGYVLMYSTESYEWDETKDYLWPIPKDQIDATGGVLTQNPGY